MLLKVHLLCRSCRMAAKSKQRRDAGSARSRRLRARLRTRRCAALQRASRCEIRERGTSLEFQSSLARTVGERLDASVIKVAAAVEDDGLDAHLLRVRGE